MTTLRRNDLVNLSISGMFIILVLLITWIALTKIEKQTKLNSKEALQTVLETTQDALSIWISQRKHNIQKLTALPEIRELTKALLKEPSDAISLRSNLHQTKLRHFMHRRLHELSDRGFFIVNPEMINIASTRNDNLGNKSLIHLQRPEYMKRLFQGETVFIPTIRSDVPLNDKQGQLTTDIPTIFIGNPVRDEHGKIIAVFFIHMDPFIHFIRITQIGRLGKTGETYAFDKQANLITESRFDKQLRRIGLIEAGKKGILTIRIKNPGSNLLTASNSKKTLLKKELTLMARNAIAGDTGFNIDGYRDYRGVKVFGAWLWDNKMGFGLTTEIDMDEALQPFYATRLIVVAVLTSTVALSFTLILILFNVRKQSEQSLKKAYNELEFRVDERTHQLKKTRNELQLTNEKLSVLATIDPLTNLANRRYFDQHYKNEWSRCKRNHQPLSILMLDIDYFKAYNDNYGHPAGDACLKQISLILAGIHTASRPGDIVARYGGEEFIILLSGTPNKQAIDIANHISATIQKEDIPHENNNIDSINTLTVSIGIATESDWDQDTPETLISMADKALYEAKKQGRNRVIASQNKTDI